MLAISFLTSLSYLVIRLFIDPLEGIIFDIGMGLRSDRHLVLIGIFYLIHDIIVKTNLFMLSGVVYRITGTNSMRDLGGIYAKHPKISLLLFIPLFSLVGIPPLSGFWPKINLIKAKMNQDKSR